MKKDGYTWWTKRIKAMSELYDVVRIDHFRGFDSYYAIPAKDKTARNGEWREGPGMDLFNALEKKLGRLKYYCRRFGLFNTVRKTVVKGYRFPWNEVNPVCFRQQRRE